MASLQDKQVLGDEASIELPGVRDGQPRAIVLAAIEVFAERGFHAATTRDIAARADMSPAGLYVHFRSKESVLLAICMAAHKMTDRLVEAGLTGEPSVPQLAHAIGTLAGWHARYYRMARVAQYELDGLQPELRAEVHALRRVTQDRIIGYLQELVLRCEVDTKDVRSLARALVSLCVDVCRWYNPAGTLSAQNITDIYTDLALRLLCAQCGV